MEVLRPQYILEVLWSWALMERLIMLILRATPKQRLLLNCRSRFSVLVL